MNSIEEMSDAELRIAIATEFVPRRWENVRLDGRGRVVARPVGMISERPIIVPDFVTDINEAGWLEKAIRENGFGDSYIVNLRRLAGRVDNISGRQICEAVLMTLRSTSTCAA